MKNMIYYKRKKNAHGRIEINGKMEKTLDRSFDLARVRKQRQYLGSALLSAKDRDLLL